MKRVVDLIVSASWVVPVQPAGVLHNHAVAVNNSRIVDLLPIQECSEKYEGKESHHLEGHALIPGMINAHTHTGMNLLKGYADDYPLSTCIANE
jgi:5-methylthioadenosine/S-adenosylhomocysteine deaminase